MPTDQKKIDSIRRREERLSAWLDDHAPYARADQQHLRANTPERAYWHYGYMIALRDVLTLLYNADISNEDTQR